MRFFVPNTRPEHAESFYRTLLFRASRSGPIADRRYFSINYSQDGACVTAEVGKLHQTKKDEIVIAIFEREGGAFLIYTERREQRGIRGPYLAHPTDVTVFEDARSLLDAVAAP